ncbi:hypothetical protein MLD38_013567 [Melastoma candidum]|uniref:Uncharacterized protein n=1 Tax=Melastoma candidum TaxID=119954 RepID=A0ACB9R9Z8_9MYRT|nr:hypothetical protein MLD38_013567 [Melastoma candidum]
MYSSHPLIEECLPRHNHRSRPDRMCARGDISGEISPLQQRAAQSHSGLSWKRVTLRTAIASSWLQKIHYLGLIL